MIVCILYYHSTVYLYLDGRAKMNDKMTGTSTDVYVQVLNYNQCLIVT